VALAADADAAVLVLDGGMPGGDLRAVAQGIESQPGTAVLVVGPVQPSSEVLVALACGISGYIANDSDPAAIADAVDALYAGGLVVPPSTTHPLVGHLREGGRRIVVNRADGTTARLTHREWEVLVLMRQDYSTAEMAEALVVSGTTVRSHVSSLVRKLGVDGRQGLAEPPTT
jgi:DNA-binding NarL/FixJ family response regulator